MEINSISSHSHEFIFDIHQSLCQQTAPCCSWGTGKSTRRPSWSLLHIQPPPPHHQHQNSEDSWINISSCCMRVISYIVSFLVIRFQITPVSLSSRQILRRSPGPFYLSLSWHQEMKDVRRVAPLALRMLVRDFQLLSADCLATSSREEDPPFQWI